MDGERPGYRLNEKGPARGVPRQTSVNTEYPIVYHDRQRQEVEHVREIRPHMR